MTREEFILQAAISMAGNENFAYQGRLDKDAIVREAEKLADELEEKCDDVLYQSDGDTQIDIISENLGNIYDALNDIRHTLSIKPRTT